MDEFCRFAVWALYVAFIVWAAVAAGRRVGRPNGKPGDGR